MLAAALLAVSARNMAAARTDPAQADWETFRRRFISPDGRVIDTGNGGVSHSEGQGWGLLFAQHFDDYATFEQILRWTRNSLRRPNDALHAWRYRSGATNPVSDTNNATDGDLLIAWALARAARQWGSPDLAKSASAIAHDVLRSLTVQLDGQLLLLPGLAGFRTDAAVIINLSYYIFPAFAALSELVPSGDWARLRQSGLHLASTARFGQWQLPPDWLQVGRSSGALVPAPAWPPLCSYDAIRLPLYLIWAGLPSPAIGAFAAFYAPRNSVRAPAWVNLQTGAEAPYAAPAGMIAIARMAAAAGAGTSGPVDLPAVAEAADYYSASLILLSRIAWQERNGT